VRDYLYLTAEGRTFKQQLTEEDRYDKRLDRTAARSRLVFNYPLTNMGTQIVDNAFHKAFLSFPMFQRDIFGWAKNKWHAEEDILAVDFRHFERFTGYACELWAQKCGGYYGLALMKMLDTPFLLPAIGSGDQNFKPYFVSRASKGYSIQLGSGLSTVSVIQKILMLCVYAKYWSESFGYSPDEAVARLVSQKTRIRIHNYGDDNFFDGKKSDLQNLYKYLDDIMDVEVEDPPAFLGMNYGTYFYSSSLSYYKGAFMRERPPGSIFRPYPYLGWKYRDENYAVLGESRVPQEDIPWVNDVLFPKYGVTRSFVQDQQKKELARIATEGGFYPSFLAATLDKEYLLTQEQRAAMGEYYTVLGLDYTTDFVEKALAPL
jgi:hypothetical protein